MAWLSLWYTLYIAFRSRDCILLCNQAWKTYIRSSNKAASILNHL
jgi:hypothetical protein